MNGKKQIPPAIVFVLLLGSLWALSEALFNSVLRSIGFPLRAGMLTGVGMGILGVGAGAFGSPVLLLLATGAAVGFRLLAVPVLGLPVSCLANSVLAVGIEGLALAGILAVAGRAAERDKRYRPLIAGSAVLTAAAVFYFAGLRLAPCAYLLSFRGAAGFMRFLLLEGLVWAVFSALLFPLGCLLGERRRERLLALAGRRPTLTYTTAVLLTGISFAASLLGVVTLR